MKDILKFKTPRPPRFSHHPSPGYKVGGRIWIEKDGELYMGRGRAMLLDRIDCYGSIAAAARSMALGYRNAWLWIEAANRLAPGPLVEKVPGGRHGGTTRLTEEGRRAVAQYQRLWEDFQEYLSKAR